ncbi:MAG TPA: DUF58 domain-containing protein, partial [Sandaracinaceae bacterium LLY-WYZ-13_1]|nr:DUF58 domain-containing protein [Sandaracinaceae bacterium LLY-WYZ-13_1]
ARRGPLALRRVEVRTRFPFGLFEKSRTFDVEDELLVFPALQPRAALPRGRAQAGPDVSTPRTGPGTEVAGLRDYVPGDEARAIHWRRSAALDRVVVRERQRDAARRVTLEVDETRPGDADEGWDARFEDALSQAATAAVHALDRGSAVEVAARTGRSPLVPAGQPPDPVWRFLARLEPVPADAEAAPRSPDAAGETRRSA